MTSVYAEQRPRRAPRRLVACVWTQVNAGAAEYRQLVVPDGCSDLIWQSGGVRLVGPDRAAWLAPLAAGSAIAGVRLRPGAARVVLGRMPVDAVRDLQVPVELLGVRAPLADRLAATDSPEAAARVLEEYVAALAARYEPDPAVDEVVRILRPGGAAPHLPALADAVGLSERQLRRRFTEAVGYAPKTLHSILRFQHALELGRSTSFGLADVAYQAGYADQAHFTREVRRLAGVTPRALFGASE